MILTPADEGIMAAVRDANSGAGSDGLYDALVAALFYECDFPLTQAQEIAYAEVHGRTA